MKALVTGAGGFVGSHLVDHLIAQGYDVRAAVHYRGDGGTGQLASPCEVVRGDVCDAEWYAEVAKGCDVIYHLAAQAGLTHSFAAPDHHLRVNAGGCLAALQAASRLGIRMVQMSTSEVYGSARRAPMDEDHPLSAQSPYAASKAAAEQMCLAFAHSYQTDVRVARCFNVYGPRQSERAVIPYIVATVLRGAGAGRIDVPLADPTVRRDFTYVGDTVRALRLIGEAPRIEEPVNVASGRDVSLAEIVERVGDVLGVEAHAVADPAHARPGSSEVLRLIGDASRLHGLTGWAPAIGLPTGLEHVSNWLRPRLAALREGRAI